MEIKINLKDLFDEEYHDYDESGLSVDKIIKDQIIYEVKAAISASIKEDVKKEITEAVKKEVSENITHMIRAKLLQFMEIGLINPSNTKNGEMPINDYLKKQWEENRGWNSLESQIKSFSDKAVKEMKDRYDNAFAMHIVKSLSKQKLLKEDIADI